MEEKICNIINKIEKVTEELDNIGIIPDYFKDDILKAIEKLIDCSKKIETETTY